MQNTEKILRKLDLYRKEPDIVQPLSNAELADLVIVVLSQVRLIEDAIGSKKLDLDKKIGQEANTLVSNTKKEVETLRQTLTNQIQELINTNSQVLSSTSTELEQRVNAAIANIRNGDNGIITEAEIERAASVALSMLELPDFDALVTSQITSNGEAIRDALELLTGDARYKVEVADVEGLTEMLNNLSTIRTANGGTIGKQQVYGFIRQALADGTITSGSSLDITYSPTQPTDPADGDLWIDTSVAKVIFNTELNILHQTTHTQYLDGVTDSEIYRFTLPTGQALVLTAIEVAERGGGSQNDNFTVEIYDVTNATSLATCSLNQSKSLTIETDSAIIYSIRVTNDAGTDKDACFSIKGYYIYGA